MTRPRDAALAWIQNQLRLAFPENNPLQLSDYGDSLFAIAEQYDIPDESLIWWIHQRHSNKDFSPRAWRLWCARYADAALRLPTEALTPPEVPAAPEPAVLCMLCFARTVQRVDKLWWCSVCGEIQV